MTSVLLQPAASDEADTHYKATMKAGISSATLREHLSASDVDELSSRFGPNPIHAWGVTRGAKGQNATKWRRIRTGDIALFAKLKVVFSSATVVHVAHSAPLATDLWGVNDDGDTWEFMYFVDEVRTQAIPYDALAAARGRAWGGRPFTVLTPQESDRVLAAFDLDSQAYAPTVSDGQFVHVASSLVLDPEEPLDAIGRAWRRTEQAKVRQHLFGSAKKAPCGLCGRQLPVDLLVAAHIKRRSVCTPVERCDYQNLVMPMCKLGCDDLFERGYLTVVEGKLLAAGDGTLTPDLEAHVTAINGRSVPFWTEQSAGFFAWHASNVFRGEA